MICRRRHMAVSGLWIAADMLSGLRRCLHNNDYAPIIIQYQYVTIMPPRGTGNILPPRCRRGGIRRLFAPALVLLAVVLTVAFDDGIDRLFRSLVGSAGADVTGAALSGPAFVIDGDTLEVKRQRIRLSGIDAPESDQTCQNSIGATYRCGDYATRMLREGIGQRAVTCDARDRDRYGRLIAVCHLGGTDLNAWMVRNGLALAYRRYSMDYAPQEDLARAEGRGLWAGGFIAPWDWRRGAR